MKACNCLVLRSGKGEIRDIRNESDESCKEAVGYNEIAAASFFIPALSCLYGIALESQ